MQTLLEKLVFYRTISKAILSHATLLINFIEPILKSISPAKAVMPAKAGIQKSPKNWIPACAGITKRDLKMKNWDFEIGSSNSMI